MWVKVAGSYDDEAFGVVDGGREGGSKESVIIRHGIEGECNNPRQEGLNR